MKSLLVAMMVFTNLLLVQTLLADELQTFPVDPVVLITTGEEVAGDQSIAVERRGFRYEFKDAANQTEFQAHPDKYEVQLGGACARMGPLSGRARVDLYAVHDGKIYLFASPGCRETFIKHADQLLEGDDPVPDLTPEQAARGRELLDVAIRAAGGAEKIDALETYRDRVSRIEGQDGAAYDETTTRCIAFPDRYSERQDWTKTSWWIISLTPEGAWIRDPRSVEAMVDSQRRSLQRRMNRHPLVIMRARSAPGFICGADGEQDVAGKSAHRLVVAFGGATTALLIDPSDGKILGSSYRGRGPTAQMGTIDVTYSDFGNFAGLHLPRTSAVSFDDEPSAEMSFTLDEITPNAKLEPTVFAP